MLNRVRMLRNVGQFDSVTGAIELRRLTLIYAENGRGKTTIAAILRSLRTGAALPIQERRRLGAVHAPEVILDCTGMPSRAHFQNGAWSRTCPEIVVFDDAFVDENVYSGLEVAADHRQNLHELILGARGVALARRVDDLGTRIREHNTELRAKAQAVPEVERHGIAIDEFCALPAAAQVDEIIVDAEQRVRAIDQQDVVRNTPGFTEVTLPAVDEGALAQLLGRSVDDLDDSAAKAVREHLTKLGRSGERWIAEGVALGAGSDGQAGCPFCAQSLDDSPLFAHYRAYFGAAYAALQKAVDDLDRRVQSTFSGDALAGFERQLHALRERRQFWSTVCTVPEFDIDSTALAERWQGLRAALAGAIASKRAEPLRPIMLDDAVRAAFAAFATTAAQVAQLNETLRAANESVDLAKETAAAGQAATARAHLQRMQATRSRHTPATAVLCDAYLQERAAKAATEAEKVEAQRELDVYRSTIFPTYQSEINRYLVRFNAGFSVESVEPQNAAGRPSCTYQLVINAHRVQVGASNRAGMPAFKNTLSAGDRNTLALAFFLVSLRQDQNLAGNIVVVDDPVSSLDEHRQLATVQEVRDLVPHVAQVIVLSHSKPFLARIWQHADHPNAAALTVARDGSGSTLSSWDVTAENVTEYDRRHARLRDFVARGTGDPRGIAQDIRPVLEGFLRVACPETFPPGTLLGHFRGIARQRANAGSPVLFSGAFEVIHFASRS